MDRNSEIWQGIVARATHTPDKKKHQIIEATIHLIAHRGVDSVTFESIGRALKTTKANVKYHFQDKHELIFTVGRLVVSGAQAMTALRVEKVATPSEKLLAIVDAAYDWHFEFYDHAKVWLLFLYFAMTDDACAKFFRDTRTVGQNRMALLLGALPRTGKVSDFELLMIAEDIQNILYGQMLALSAGSTSRPPRTRYHANREQALAMIQNLLEEKDINWHARG